MEYDLSKQSKPFQQERFGTMVVDSPVAQNRPLSAAITATGSIGALPVTSSGAAVTGTGGYTLTTGTGASLIAAFPAGSTVGSVCGPFVVINQSSGSVTLVRFILLLSC